VTGGQLPKFDLQAYRMLLLDLRAHGYDFLKISEMKNDFQGNVTYLRHDVDLHLHGILPIAMLEAELGIHSTYYIPLTLHFNPLYPANKNIISKIVVLGHDVGLHYDLGTYPIEPVYARKHLEWEIGILSQITGQPIRTICMHNPYKGQPDPFLMLDDYIHPHDPRSQWDLIYISDSCRAWRDERLLLCLSKYPPRRLLLNTHPELWLDGSMLDRIKYLDEILIEMGVRQNRDYFEEVRMIWQTHPATRQHDERERGNK
jgi:hypothetical protein